MKPLSDKIFDWIVNALMWAVVFSCTYAAAVSLFRDGNPYIKGAAVISLMLMMGVYIAAIIRWVHKHE